MKTAGTVVVWMGGYFGVIYTLNKVAQITAQGIHNYLSNHFGESPAKAICILLAITLTFGYLWKNKINYSLIEESNENTNH